MKHYEINIDLEDLMSGKMDKKLKFIEKAIDIGTQRGLEKCEIKIRAKLSENMALYGLGNSNLSKTMVSTRTKDGLYVGMEGEYFMYVEYGTGVVGRDNSHPDTSRVSWRYDTNNRGEMGWWYPTDIDDPNPTKYRGDYGWYAWTRGQRAKPFMYDTWKWAMVESPKIILAEIEKEISKLEGRTL